MGRTDRRNGRNDELADVQIRDVEAAEALPLGGCDSY